jgi:DNA polymerase III subunit epsilon
MSIETANFVALDFETANEDLSSICQVGIVIFQRGQPVESQVILVDPEDHFSPINVAIHGITEVAALGAAIFPDIYDRLLYYLSGRVVVSHTTFDQAALRQAVLKYGLPVTDCRWLDTTRVVRRQWPQFASAGYGLANITREFGIEIRCHDAAEDARGTGLILVRATNESGLGLDDWLIKAYRPISDGRVAKDGEPDGPLYGGIAVFTGALSMSRREATEIAARLGLKVDDDVTKHTTLLVVGYQNMKKLAPGATKSTKLRIPAAITYQRQSMETVIFP